MDTTDDKRGEKRRLHLNHKVVEGLKAAPGAHETTYYDVSLKGFGVRVYATGRKTFTMRKRVNGKLRRVPIVDPTTKAETFPMLSLAKARELAGGASEAMRTGRDLSVERRAAASAEDLKYQRTVRALGALYIEHYAKPRKKSWQNDDSALRNQVVPVLGDLPVVDVTRAHVRALLDTMVQRGAKVHANRVAALLSKMFYYAIELSWRETHPCVRMMRQVEVSRDRVLRESEIRQLWAWLSQPTAPPSWVEAQATKSRRRVADPSNQWPLVCAYMKLRLLTLQRSSELVNMQWSHIDGLETDAAVWDKPAKETKNGKPHTTPLAPMASAILQTLSERNGDPTYVFAGIRSKRDRQNVCAGAGLKDFQYRDLRRTAATTLGKLKVNEKTISRLLNHTEGGITTIYNRHEYDDEKRAALELWEKRLQQILSREADQSAA